MQLIVDDLVQDKKFHEDNTHHKLVVTGADPVPIEISEGGVVISRAYLATSHEEADNIIVQQVLSCAAENAESKIIVVADDTDVFVLLLHYHHMANLKNVVLMESPIKGRTVVHIGKTVQKYSEIVEGILRYMHFLAVTPLPPILELERPLYSKHFDRDTDLTCWVHQGILWNMLFNRLPPPFPRAVDKQTVVQCQRQG